MIQYLKDLIDEFITEYPEFSKVKTSVGTTNHLDGEINLNDLPLILVEDINFSSDTFNLTTVGDLDFQVMYFDIDTLKNGYINLDTEFTQKFTTFLCTKKGDIKINNISYYTEEDNIYIVAIELTAVYSL